MQTPQFKEDKAIQMAATFIEREGGVINYTKLIKLMYLADRKALLSWERPITGDSYLSMNKGPVLSKTLNLIKENQSPEGLWAEFITEPKDYEVALAKACPIDALSEAEAELIEEVFQKYGHLNRFELIDLVHEFPEWEDPGYGKSSPIPLRKIFEGAGFSEPDITDIEQEIDSLNKAKAMLGCN